ncbi:MAG TPA: ROK family glucokinase [Marmoricola sp.]|nr:ROK family glucokinase [Marmoricola sp.]
MSLTIGIDIGGTKLSGGVVDEEGTLLASSRRESPARDPRAIVEAVKQLVAELRASDDVDGDAVEAVGLAAAGYVDADRSMVIYAPNLAWRNEPLRDLVSAATGLRVVVENDANAAAWAEYVHGAGQGARTLLMATIGTGIGGGIVHDGALLRGGNGGAAEIGHIRLVEAGRLCPCGLRGCWEAYGSGTALTLEARQRAAVQPEKARMLLELAGGDAQAISGPMVSAAAQRGDPVAIEAFDVIERRIGEGVASLSAVLDPDVVVIGGGVSESHDLSLEQIKHSFTSHVSGGVYRPAPDIRRGTLGNSAGMIGVAALARL